jgi:hypothetical protein
MAARTAFMRLSGAVTIGAISAAACLAVPSPASADGPCHAGCVQIAALVFHEAWYEAQLSVPPGEKLEAEWRALLAWFRAEARRCAIGKVDIKVYGDVAQWRVEAVPTCGPAWSLVTPQGVEFKFNRHMRWREEPDPGPVTSLVNSSPLRHFYDCSGRRLRPQFPPADSAPRDHVCSSNGATRRTFTLEPSPKRNDDPFAWVEEVKASSYSTEEKTDRLYRVIADTGYALDQQNLVVLPETRQLPAMPGKGYRLHYCNQDILVMRNKRAWLMEMRCPWRSP